MSTDNNLHAECVKILHRISTIDEEAREPADIGELRSLLDRYQSAFEGDLAPVADVEDIEIPCIDGPRPARRYLPLTPDEDLRTILYFHGGGWISGGLDSHESIARQLCAAVGATVLALDYRLAPEHPFPAAFRDGLSALHWVVESSATSGSREVLGIAGDSAGGNLAAAVANAATEAGIALGAQLLMYPATDLSARYPSMDRLGRGFVLATEGAEPIGGQYFGAELRRSDPRASPILAALDGAPPAVVVVGEFDPIRDQGAVYASKLIASGVDTTFRVAPGMIHGFMNATASPGIRKEADRVCHDFAYALSSARAASGE